MKVRRLDDYIIDTVVLITMIFVLAITLYPFYYVLVISLNDGIDATRGGIYFFPRMFSLDNYIKVFSDDKWTNALLISVSRTITGTLIGVIFSSIVAYALSFKKLLLKKLYFFLIIFSMYFSGGLIPYYIVLKQIHMTNTFWVYIIPGCLNAFYILVLISFYKEIPEALHEAAKIDGANDLYIYYKIIIPLSLPVLSTISLFFAVAHWNSWMDSAFFVQKSSLRPLAYIMMDIINKNSTASMMQASGDPARAADAMRVTSVSLQMASMIIAVLPILFVYPFLQKYFIQGILIGSVKE